MVDTIIVEISINDCTLVVP